MSAPYRDRVTTVSNASSPDLICVIGGHVMVATLTIKDHWVHTLIDGHPVCPEHLMLIADTRTPETIPESRIKKILIDRANELQRAKVRESLRKSAQSAQPGWIYYVQIGELIKIGYTENLQQRISHYPPNAIIKAVHPGTPALEKSIHRQFQESRARGREWFRMSTPLNDHMAGVLERFGSVEGIVKPMRHV